MAKIAWYGAGMMGSGFVEALRRRGDEVTVWNRTPEKARALERFGARACEDPREAARGAEVIHIILSDDAAVDALLDRLDGAVERGTIVVDHTTVAPRPTTARFEVCAQRGIEFLHAPVFMSPQACRDSTGLMMCSGPAQRFERVEPELKKMTGAVWYLGERGDKAAALKLVGNQMLFFITAGLADGYALGRSVGLSPAETYELFAHFKPGGAIDARGKNMAEGNFKATFELTMARKDARLMLETAQAGGVPLAVLPAIAQRFDEMIAAGHGKDDMGVLALDEQPAKD
jgi:3-hydroxyisobutyrate dehydrogenase